ncbi:conserved hypothetical protein [Xenorhabdus bovienii str. Jollieti]|nr:conserved hypothetical protein [Xenorhabdus bovienii str. Jollieti]
MKAKALSLWNKLMLRKRFLIETAGDQLKNISQIEHSNTVVSSVFYWKLSLA